MPDNSLKKKSFKRVLNGAISGSNLGSRSAVTLRVRGECALCRLNTMSVTSGQTETTGQQQRHNSPCHRHRPTKHIMAVTCRLTFPDISLASREGCSTFLSQTPPGFIYLGMITVSFQRRTCLAEEFRKSKSVFCIVAGPEALLTVISPDVLR